MKQLLFVVSLLFIFSLIFTPVYAGELSRRDERSDIPERNGDYPEPKYPGIRVRVIVHEPKNAGTKLPLTPACTDNDSSAVVNAAGWKLPSGSWTYQLNTGSVPSSVGSSKLPAIAANSFAVWANAQSSITFVRGADTSITRSKYDQKNIITWGTTSGSSTLGVTYIRYNSLTKYVVDVDTILNRRVKWSWTDPAISVCSASLNTYDAQDVLTHELGHWMGLDDEYNASYADNTMFGYASTAEIKKDTLTSGDINGILNIYP